MALGARIGQLLEASGLGQEEVADRVNALAGGAKRLLSQQGLGALIARDSKTSVAAPYLADVFGVSLRWLLTGQGRKDDADWPFKRVLRSRWDACSDEDRGYVQAAINKALDECEAARAGGPSGKPLGMAA
jgi:transcriptional regulator with XRE-family HTH domain